MSARDKFKNSNRLGLDNESGAETITNVIQKNYESQTTIQISNEEVKIDPPKPVPKKRAPGRPRKFSKNEVTVFLGIQVKEDLAKFLEQYGGIYGGKTGYVTHLIREEMKRLGVEK